MIDLRRRSLLKAGAIGTGLLAAPAGAIGPARGFTHGVASGEPGATGVLLWTRFVPARGDAVPLSFEVAEDPGFGRIVARGDTVALADNDHCAKPRVDGLTPDRWYYYRFAAPDGARSMTGRTRTLPQGPTRQFRIAAFSCSNKPFGWFNAYAHAAARNDIDLVIHLGDYFYEYERGDYPSAAETVAGRPIEPANEAYRLQDYRARFAAYRDDPDLQRLHQLFPCLQMWDDHETANDAWTGGAQNHQPEREGPWEVRKAAARKAFREWLPASDEDYQSYDIGDLVTLIRTDTRLAGRDQPIELGAVLADATDAQAALIGLRDGAWSDPKRQMLGAAQEAWLADRLNASVASGARWQLVAQQVLAGAISTPTDVTADWLGPNPSRFAKARVGAGIAAAKLGLPFNWDSWGGYPAARARMLGAAQAAGANLVTIAGDSHNAWAFELANDGRPAGVEFATCSVTSPGLENYLRAVSPDQVERSLVAANPELKWCDTSRRGYMALTFTPDAVRCDWQLLDTIRQRSTASRTRSLRVARGSPRLMEA
jgi:alkaline phosphatase D